MTRTHRKRAEPPVRYLTVSGLDRQQSDLVGTLSLYTHPLPGNVTDDFAKEIVYYKLSLNWTASGAPNCLYASISGVQRYDDNRTVTQDDVQIFIDNLIAEGGPPDFSVQPYNLLNDAPNIGVMYPCYVVIDMDVPFGLRFIDNLPAIMTKEDFGTSKKYCNLVQYDDVGDATAGHSSGDIDNPCCLISFGVRYISPSPHLELDPFNYSLESGSDPYPTYHYIDPVIKNRGPR